MNNFLAIDRLHLPALAWLLNWSGIDLLLVLLVTALVVIAWLSGVAGKAKGNLVSTSDRI